MPDDTWSPPAPGTPPAGGHPPPAPGYPPPGGSYPPPGFPPPAGGFPPPAPGAGPAGAYPPFAPGVDGGAPPGRHVRPWWGLGDVLLSVPVIIFIATVGSLLGLPFLSAAERSAVLNRQLTTTPTAMIAASLVAQQLSQGAWPFLVSKWKGLGPARDWRLQFKPIDPLIGIGTALIAFALSAAAGGIVAHLVHLADESEADNTQFLVDAKGTAWLWVLLFTAVIGAPLVEELFFRGLTLRAFEKRWGPVAAVIGSTLVFTLPHFQKPELAPTLVLFASIGCVGLVFALVAINVGRLGPTIVAHMIFNAIGAASALGVFHNLRG